MSFCGKCGKPLKPGNSFCTFCGNPVVSEGENILNDSVPEQTETTEETVSVTQESFDGAQNTFNDAQDSFNETQDTFNGAQDTFNGAQDTFNGAHSFNGTIGIFDEPPSAFDRTQAFNGMQGAFNGTQTSNETQGAFNGTQTSNETQRMDNGIQSFDFNTPVPEKKSKFKKKFTIILAAVLVLIATSVFGFFKIPIFRNFMMRTFASPGTYLRYVIAENIAPVKEIENFADSTYEANVKVSLNEDISKKLALLGDAGKILKNIKDSELNVITAVNDTQYAVGLKASVNGTEIGTANLSADLEKKSMFIDLNDLNEKAFGIEQDDREAEEIMRSMKTSQMLKDHKKDFKNLANKYLKIVVSDLDDLKKGGNTNLKAGDLSNKYHTVSFVVKDSTARKIIKDVLEEAKDDDKLQDLLVEFPEIVGEPDFSKSDFKKGIKEALEDIDDIEFDEEIKVVLYVDGKANIRGIIITEEEEDIEVFNYADVMKGNKFATEITIQDVFEFTGDGTVKGNSRTGEYIASLPSEGMDLFTISLSDFGTEPLNGQISFGLSSDVIKQMGIDYATATIAKDAKIVLDISKAKDDTFEGSIKLNYNDADAITFDITSTRKDGTNIEFPSHFTSSQSEWMNGIKEDVLESRMKDAGVPIN